MIVTDCYWEFLNLGCHVAEVGVERNEIIDKDAILEIEKDYDYIVVKIPSGMPLAYTSISELGYSFIESQISLNKKSKDFVIENNLVKRVYNGIRVEIIEKEKDLQRILSKMTPDMFSTDRIYLDPHFGSDYSLRRYRNWLQEEFKRGSMLSHTFYNDKEVCFNLTRTSNGIRSGLLGGLFEEFQSAGLGLVLMLSIYWLKNNGYDFKLYKTKVSSNNLPVIQLYNFLHYEQVGFDNVFIKHVRKQPIII